MMLARDGWAAYGASMTLRRMVPITCVAAFSIAVGATAATRPTGAVETCSGQSSASFPGAFTSRDNLVVGPLVLVGGSRFTSAETVRRFSGNKFPALVAAGHRVTIELTPRTRRFASLRYGSLPRARRLTVRDGHRVVTFRSCDRDEALSVAGGRRVTFWSGFVLASGPHCVPLRVWVDGEPEPRRARIPLGRRCP
jgi:hypothetical protein